MHLVVVNRVHGVGHQRAAPLGEQVAVVLRVGLDADALPLLVALQPLSVGQEAVVVAGQVDKEAARLAAIYLQNELVLALEV